MGSGTAEAAALRGLDGTVAESTPELAAADRERVAASLDRGLRRGKFGEAGRDRGLARLSSPMIWASWRPADRHRGRRREHAKRAEARHPGFVASGGETLDHPRRIR
ncbi:MAG: hypothetical protein ACJ736_04845 [Streptomyces sp.]